MRPMKSSVKKFKVKLRLIEVYDLKPGVRGYEKMVNTGKPVKCTVICKEDFEKYVVKERLSRDKANSILGISHHLYQNTIHYWYDYDCIKGQKVDKMIEANREERKALWNSSLKYLEKFYPGITELFLNNLQNPEPITEKLLEMNSDFYEIKAFIHLTKKYIRQACKRHNVPYIKFPANLQEYRVYRILRDLGYKVQCQFYINPYWYDFKIGKVLIEYDGKQYHSHKGELNHRDKIKIKLAEKNGYTVLRIPYYIDGYRTDRDIVRTTKYIKKLLKPCSHLLK